MPRPGGGDLMTVERAIGCLGDLNLSAVRELELFYGRSDETGMIAQTARRVCGCLRKTIDVTENESYYIGDFSVLSPREPLNKSPHASSRHRFPLDFVRKS